MQSTTLLMTITTLLVGTWTTSTSAQACDRYAQRVIYPQVVEYRPVTTVVRKTVTVRPAPTEISVVAPSVEYRAQPSVRYVSKAMPTRTAIQAGETYRMSARFLGNELGAVSLSVNGLRFDCEVSNWRRDSVTFVVPALIPVGSHPAKLSLRRADGKLVKTELVQIAAAADLVHIEPVPVPTTVEEAEELASFDAELN